MHRLIIIVALCGCAQHQELADFYNDVESGSDWSLTWSAGTPNYFDHCPAIAAKQIHVADGTSSGCEPGCTCALTFELYDDGELSTDYDLYESYDQSCDDGSQLTCYPGYDLVTAGHSIVDCDWWPPGWDHDVFHTGCSYTLEIQRLDR